MTENEEIASHLEALADCVVRLDIQGTLTTAGKALAVGVPAVKAISEGLAEGMRRVGEKYSCGEYFVPEVLVASRALYAGMDVLKPHIEISESEEKPAVMMGVVKGDVHDIGKNIVKLFWEAAGYSIIDLGKNVPLNLFLTEIEHKKPLALGLSTLMTSTLGSLEKTVNAVRDEFGSSGIKILVGGACVTREYANDIGADFWGKDGPSAVEGLKQLIGSPVG